MRSLSFLSLTLLIVFSSCHSVRPRHLVPADRVQPTDLHPSDPIGQRSSTSGTLPALFAPPAFQKALFKAAMDIRGHHLTGLLFLKMIPDTGYRILFSNEFGMTYFDLEVGTDFFRMNYCFEPLNNQALWRVMETDLRLLLPSSSPCSPSGLFVCTGSVSPVIHSRQGKIVRWDCYSPTGDTLVETRGRSTMMDQAILEFSEYAGGFPNRITIRNPVIRLHLSFTLLSLN